MHPDLSPHLHTQECQNLITKFHECHKNHPFKKFIGICNELDKAVYKCLKNERIERRRQNQEKARMLQERGKKAKTCV